MISKLNYVSKAVGGSSAKQDDRDQRKLHVLEQASKTYNAFAKEFSTVKPSQTRDMPWIALKIVWKRFPGRPGLENKVGNPENPGDGLLYNGEYVEGVKSVLRDLDKAWRNTESVAHISPSPQLQGIGRKCLILIGMQRQDLLVYFLESGLSDFDLRLDKQKLRDVLKEEYHHEAIFIWHRAVSSEATWVGGRVPSKLLRWRANAVGLPCWGTFMGIIWRYYESWGFFDRGYLCPEAAKNFVRWNVRAVSQES